MWSIDLIKFVFLVNNLWLTLGVLVLSLISSVHLLKHNKQKKCWLLFRILVIHVRSYILFCPLFSSTILFHSTTLIIELPLETNYY